VIEQHPLSTMVELGRSVTLSCYIHKMYPSSNLVWIKQVCGGPPRSVGSTEKNLPLMEDEFNHREKFTIERSGNDFQLHIYSIQPADAGRYYCAAVRFKSVTLGNGTYIWLKGSASVSRRVEQQPASVPVQPGDSVTLQCTIHTETCAGEHSVHWFRHGSGEALPGLIYTHGNRSDPCESSSEPGLPAQGCVYELPKRNLRSSDAGTYYCAVATCGQILFGNGTRLEFAGKLQFQINV
ncbi:KV3AJ protein, partial [Amia calva]|nr:KV3AJ protein [Amia calva]